MVNLKLIIGFLIVGLMIVSACNFGGNPIYNDCKTVDDCAEGSFCNDDGNCETCPVPDCAAPEPGCHYETTIMDNGCENACGNYTCEDECKTVDDCAEGSFCNDDGQCETCGPSLCVPLKEGCHYETTIMDNGCENDCGAINCSESIVNLPKPILSYDFREEQSKPLIPEKVGKLSGYDLAISNGEYDWPAKTLWIDGDTILKASGKDLAMALVKEEEFSIEVYFEPENLQQSGPARIITLSKDPSFRDFTLGQSEEGLQWRVRTVNADENGGPSSKRVEIDSILEPKPVHVVALYDGQTSKVYVNGVLAGQKDIGGDLLNWDTSYDFALGNEIDNSGENNRPWAGELYKASVYDFALDEAEIAALYANRNK